MSREAQSESIERASDHEPPPVPGDLPADERAEALRALIWIRDFSEAHHAQEPDGVHLHRLLVDIPHYMDYVIGILKGDEDRDGKR